jgi:FkbM family methyltransferase
MVRSCLQLAAGTALLVLANGQISISQLSTAIEATNECGDETCALELAQLRASKMSTKPNNKDEPKVPKAKTAKLVSKTKTDASTQEKVKTKTDKTKVQSKKVESKETKSGKMDVDHHQKGHKHHAGETGRSSYHHPAWLKDCKKVFLDLGANIGVNVRKLFEPKKYLGDQLEPYFQRHFGGPGWRRAPAEKNHLCALGFEPNPQHMPRLKEIEKAYKKNGWRAHFYNYAIWREEGQMTFNNTAIRDSGADLTAEGAHLNMREVSAEVVEDGAAISKVRTVNFADFVDTLPKGTVKLVLMDIEGAEYETLAQLMAEKKLCRSWIWNLLVEAHTWGEITHWGKPESFTPGIHPRSMLAIRERVNQMNDMKWCGDNDNVTYVAKLDDETFQKDVDNSFGQNRR